MSDEAPKSWSRYYARTRTEKPNPHLAFALSRIRGRARDCRVAMDGGCGAGRDTAFLLTAGFDVHAFDPDARSITICEDRFRDLLGRGCFMHRADFVSAHYHPCAAFVATASLFFTRPATFADVWSRITSAIEPGGVFCGNLLGVRDTWASPEADTVGVVTAFESHAARNLFGGFDIARWHERDETGATVSGNAKHWHTFHVVGVKRG